DAHIRRRGSELLGHGHLILVDIDSPAAADGGPLVNALRWLADRAVEARGLLDLSATVSVRTPGHPASGHLARSPLRYRADPGRPDRAGQRGRTAGRRSHHPVRIPARRGNVPAPLTTPVVVGLPPGPPSFRGASQRAWRSGLASPS